MKHQFSNLPLVSQVNIIGGPRVLVHGTPLNPNWPQSQNGLFMTSPYSSAPSPPVDVRPLIDPLTPQIRLFPPVPLTFPHPLVSPPSHLPRLPNDLTLSPTHSVYLPSTTSRTTSVLIPHLYVHPPNLLTYFSNNFSSFSSLTLQFHNFYLSDDYLHHRLPSVTCSPTPVGTSSPFLVL